MQICISAPCHSNMKSKVSISVKVTNVNGKSECSTDPGVGLVPSDW